MSLCENPNQIDFAKPSVSKTKMKTRSISLQRPNLITGPHGFINGDFNDVDNEEEKIKRELLAGESIEDAEIRKAALQSRSRSRSSTIIQIPTASIQMDLHTLYLENFKKDAKRLHKLSHSTMSFEDDSGRKSNRFISLKHRFKKDDSVNAHSMEDFRDFLEHIRTNLIDIPTHELSFYKSKHWSDLNNNEENESRTSVEDIDNAERSRFEALWEIFYAEVTYLVDHLIVLQNVFAKSLEHVKAFGFLQNINESLLFSNLQKLIEVTSYFANKLIKIFQCWDVTIARSTVVIVDAFKQFDTVLTPAYNTYCVNYQKAKKHLDSVKDEEMMCEWIKWCEQHESCNRLHLEDFLISPLQHLTKYPLLLKAIRKCTPKNDINNKLITKTIKNTENSIQTINSKISAIVNFQRLQQIQSSIMWPTLAENDQKCYIPEVVKTDLSNCYCETVLINPNRKVMHEGSLTLVLDNNKSDFYVFLFNDMLLITKHLKKSKRRSGVSDEKPLIDGSSLKMRDKKLSIPESNHNNIQFVVHKQPIPMYRIKLYDIEDQSSNLRHLFCILHINRYHQAVSAYTFQACSSLEKTLWMRNIKEMIELSASESTSSKDHSSDEEYIV